MATGMNEVLLAQEILDAIGGKRTRDRQRAFLKLASAIIAHVRANMVVNSSGPDAQGGTVTSVSTSIL